MKIQIASDLHLEFPENRSWLKHNPLIKSSDILLLAGDIICDKYKRKGRFFYDDIQNKFKNIVTVPGNHEFYNGTISYCYPSYSGKITDNHYKINNSSIIIDDVKIIGTALWSHIPDTNRDYLYQVMNDYRYIFRKEHDEKVPLLIENTNHYHSLSVKFLENELAKPFNGKTIIVSHHLPSFKCILKDYDNKELLKYAFATNLEKLIKKYAIDLWVFGHIHESVDIKLHGTRLAANPLGYMSESQKDNFRNDFIINI